MADEQKELADYHAWYLRQETYPTPEQAWLARAVWGAHDNNSALVRRLVDEALRVLCLRGERPLRSALARSFLKVIDSEKRIADRAAAYAGAVACRHEPFEGYCVHCKAPFINGHPADTFAHLRGPAIVAIDTIACHGIGCDQPSVCEGLGMCRIAAKSERIDGDEK